MRRLTLACFRVGALLTQVATRSTSCKQELGKLTASVAEIESSPNAPTDWGAINGALADGPGKEAVMDWARILAHVTGTVDQELLARNEYLAAENLILKAQLKGRLNLSNAERATLGEIGHRLGRKVLGEVATVARPDTILAWYRKLVASKFDGSKARRGSGRPQITREVEQLIVRMASENRSWGYDRIVGALANLGFEVSDQTVGNVLRRHALPPAPERKRTTTWQAFIRTLSLLKKVFGVGIGGGRSWNMYFWAGQYIGDICDECEMNGNSGLRCMRAQRSKNAAILHAEAGASVMPRDVRSDDADHTGSNDRQGNHSKVTRAYCCTDYCRLLGPRGRRMAQPGGNRD